MERVTDKQYFIDGILKRNVDSLLYNVRNDWEAILLVTGDGLLRVGKSVLAQQVGYYIASELETPFSVENVVFSGAELIEKAVDAPKNSVFVYDESLSEMSSKRVMENVSKTLMEFFSECGMYNHVIILVLPDVFDLNKSIALNRSEFLLNVIRQKKIIKHKGQDVVKWQRGVFEFYNRKNKKFLYLNGAKFRTYTINGKRHYTFWGNFPNFWCIDKAAYEQKKIDFIRRDRLTKKEVAPGMKTARAIYNMRQDGMTNKKIGEYFEVTGERISQVARRYEKSALCNKEE